MLTKNQPIEPGCLTARCRAHCDQPSLSLLAQTLREWTANAERAFEFLAVCSDETVVGEDAVVSTTSELGFPVTTDPAPIATFLVAGEGPRVVFATYQSSPRIADAFRPGVPGFDLVVADEAHRCAGPQAGEFATVVDESRILAPRTPCTRPSEP